GLKAWAAVGLLPVLGAALAGWYLRRGDRAGFVRCYALTALLFVGVVAAHGGVTLNGAKAPQPLAELIETESGGRDVRVGAYGYFQPSLVFYCRREVLRLESDAQALEFLSYPVPVYLVTPAPAWERIKEKLSGPHQLLGRHYDLYRDGEI